MKMILVLAALAWTAIINLDDSSSVISALETVTDRAMSYYDPRLAVFGAVAPNSNQDASGIQWYESGIFWESVLQSHKRVGSGYGAIASAALANASYGPIANFLGPPSFQHIAVALLGRWNDDIMWWAFGPLTGAEMYGKDTMMPDGQSYLTLALSAYETVWSQWSDGIPECGGGIYWSSDRSSTEGNQKVYKSTITNAQFISMSARLYTLTKNQTMLDRGALVYQWLKKIGLVNSKGQVFDGVSTLDCTRVADFELSYTIGQLIGGLSQMFIATGDVTYLNDAELYCTHALQLYTLNGIIRDTCEPSCPPNQVSPKGILIRGLGELYPVSSPKIRQSIKDVITMTIKAMVSRSCDDDWNCNTLWGSEATMESNFHTQINALDLMNTVATIYAPRTNVFENRTPTIINQSKIKNYAVGLSSFIFTKLYIVTSLAFLGMA